MRAPFTMPTRAGRSRLGPLWRAESQKRANLWEVILLCAYREIADSSFRRQGLHISHLGSPGCPGTSVSQWMNVFALLPAFSRESRWRRSAGSTRSDFAFAVFERVFKEFGLPRAIRTDNGAPFASVNALFGLSRLSV